MTERERHPSSRSDTTNASADDPATIVGCGEKVNSEADPKTSEFDERRWNRGHAAVDREHAAQRREADAAERDQAQAAADERTRIRRGDAGSASTPQLAATSMRLNATVHRPKQIAAREATRGGR